MASSKGSWSEGSGRQGKPTTPGSLASDSSDASGGKSSVPSGTPYKAWMTGFSYEACRNLYLPGGVPPPRTDDQVREYRDKILPCLSTYLNLVSEWKAAGMEDVTDDLGQVVKDVRKRADLLASTPDSDKSAPAEPTVQQQWKNREASADDEFDSDFDLVLGAIRAKEPYGCYVTLSGEYCSRLTHLREGDTVARLASALRANLCEMQNALPDGAYDVIDSDLSKIESPRRGAISELERGAEGGIGRPLEKGWGRESGVKIDQPPTRRGPSVTSAEKRMLDEQIATWTDLMFGVATPEGILSARGRGLAYTLVVAVGLGLVLGIGLVVLAVLEVVAHIPGMDLSTLSMVNGSSFISTVETVSTTLTTVGLSFGLLATKAWASLQAFERATILYFAKMPRFRRHVNPLYGQ